MDPPPPTAMSPFGEIGELKTVSIVWYDEEEKVESLRAMSNLRIRGPNGLATLSNVCSLFFSFPLQFRAFLLPATAHQSVLGCAAWVPSDALLILHEQEASGAKLGQIYFFTLRIPNILSSRAQRI